MNDHSKSNWKTLPRHLIQIVKRIHSDTGMKEFIVFGGAAIDLLLDYYPPVHDFDIAIRNEVGQIQLCRKNLTRCGYHLPESNRKYFINLTVPVTNFLARDKDKTLDINFLDKFDLIGQFSLEGIVWRYPQFDYMDRFGAQNDLKNGIIRPIYGLTKENPWLLLDRILCLASKYNIPLADVQKHQAYLDQLTYRIRTWKPPNKFHGQMAMAAHYSHVFHAILRAHKKLEFVQDIYRTRLLKTTIPELQLSLENLNYTKVSKITTARNIKDLMEFFGGLLGKTQRTSLKRRLSILRLRKWERDWAMI